MFRQEFTRITSDGDFPGLLLTAERDVKKHHYFIAGDDDNVGDVEAGFRNDGHVVVHVEIEEAMNRGLGSDHVVTERKRAQNVRELLNIFILARYGNRDGKPAPRRIASATGMRDGFGDLIRREPVNVLTRPAVHADLELHGVEVNADRLRRLVAYENFDREDTDREWVGLAEFFFGAARVSVGIGHDREAFVAILSASGRLCWRRY